MGLNGALNVVLIMPKNTFEKLNSLFSETMTLLHKIIQWDVSFRNYFFTYRNYFLIYIKLLITRSGLF